MRKRRRHLLKTRDHIPRAFSRQPVSQITTIFLRAPAEEDRVERGCKVVELRLGREIPKYASVASGVNATR